jgi:NADH-quinone oxidoreductase subunit A
MLPNYLPLLILAAFAVGFGVFTVVASSVFGRPRPTLENQSTKECGVPPVGTARKRFPVKFFLVCMVFILFDVDAAFFYPWALVFRELGAQGLVEMTLFVAVLAVADIYAWKVGALDW